MKKSVIIIISIVLVAIVAIGIFIILNKTGVVGDTSDDGSGGGFISNILPFGNPAPDAEDSSGQDPANIVDGVGGESTQIYNSEQPLQKLTNTPAVGYLATTTKDGLVVRYMEQSTGNIFDIDMDRLSVKRVTNTTMPGGKEVLWHRDGERLVMRYADENDVIKTYLGKIVAPSPTSTEKISSLEGSFIENGIDAVTTNKEKTKFIYTSTKALGVYGIVSDFSGADTEAVFTSDFSEWILDWKSDEEIIATTKASFSAKGFTYGVDIGSGKFEKIYGNDYGYMASPNTDGSKIFVSKANGKNVDYPVILDRETNKVTDFGFPTFAEKCTWSSVYSHVLYCGIPLDLPEAEYPDMWYQGILSLQDAIFEINVETEDFTMISNPFKESDISVDVINPTVGPNGEYLFFINKKDSTLWSLKLERPVGVDKYEDLEEEEVLEE